MPSNYLSPRYLQIMLICAVVSLGLTVTGIWLVVKQEFMSFRMVFLAVLSALMVVIIVFIVRAALLLYRAGR